MRRKNRQSNYILCNKQLSRGRRLRVQTEFNELDLPFNGEIKFPNGIDDLMTLEVTIHPYEGHYRYGEFVFSIEIPSCYPHKPPKVKCNTEIFHPNIDYQGNVGLNILQEGWVPVHDTKTVIYGLYHLLLEPNWEISLNEEAAKVLVLDPESFDDLVQGSIANARKNRRYGERPYSTKTVRCLDNVEAFILKAEDVGEVTKRFSRFMRSPRVQRAIRKSLFICRYLQLTIRYITIYIKPPILLSFVNKTPPFCLFRLIR